MNHPAWKYRPVVALGDKCLLLYSRFEDKDACKSVPGGRWEPELKAWEYPLQPETLERLAKVFPGLNVEPEARLELAKITEGEVLMKIISKEAIMCQIFLFFKAMTTKGT